MSTVQALSAPQGLSMPTAKKIFAFASMCVGMFIALIDIQIVSASLRDIGGGLSAGDDETVWVQTSYLIAEIIIIPLSGWLARVMSTRWLFAASAAGFTLMSLLCGWAWNIQSMIAFRALQGLAGGSMIPLVFTTAFAFFQGKQRVIAAATIGGLASLAPTLGPTVGGWITENYNWHWLFFINVVPGIYIAVAVPLLVKVDSADPTLLRGADYLSILLLALSLGCLEYTLEEGPRWGWFDDATLTTTAWVALLCGVAFVIRTLRHPQPVMDLRALQDRTFSLGCYFSFMAGVGIFATIYLTPLYLGSVRGFSALEIGLAVFSTGLFQVMSIPFYSWLANRVDLRWLLMAGLIGFAVSMYSFVPITHDWGADQLLLPQAFRGLAQQFAVAPTVTLTLGSLPPARLKLASGLFNLMRNLGGAIGTGLFMGAGRNIAVAGTSILVIYVLVGFFTYMVMRAMGELLLTRHDYRSFADFVGEYLGPQASFYLGWTYWLSWVVTCIADVVVCGSYMQYWFPELSAWMPALSMLAILFLLNLLSVKMFGEAEFWFALI
ncbi:DHA2 family efflux MFS transporter permease subunit, partial [Klebsiella pneumoniae]|uniref:DHA2 family efflux MFS transporter permease subunit n=1 Tax=Klebsiella pneumoniae TaxID=573 RepID=UPI0039688EA0